ncbi:hypothetical protein FRC07_004994 [Ceratobasidium sp. 392]|nr:hypothetical protein FRC07_004994 [Ceratobasidium sp. 392]
MFSGARLRPSYANWGQLWSIMDNEGVTFPDIRDLQDFVAAPGVHSLVERTQFIKAAHYNFGDTQCILFTIDEGALSRPKPRYVAIGRVISQSVWKTILGLGSTSTATKWFNVSNYGEEQIGFLQRIFGLYDVEPLQTWKLQGKPFTISGLIADTVENYQYRPRSNLPGHTTNVAVAYRRLTWWEALLASLPSAQDDLDGAQVRKPEQVVTKVEVTRLGNAPLCIALHAQIHGDLKGENIFVSHDGIVKVADFGLAIMRHAALEFSKSDPGGGTQRWMMDLALQDYSTS